MRICILTLTAAMVVGGTSDGWAGQKPDPTPDWKCQVVFRDAAGDAIKSDTTPGSAGWPKAYRDGVDGVRCTVMNEPGVAHHQWIALSIDSTRRNPSTSTLIVGRPVTYSCGTTCARSTMP